MDERSAIQKQVKKQMEQQDYEEYLNNAAAASSKASKQQPALRLPELQKSKHHVATGQSSSSPGHLKRSETLKKQI